MDRNQLLNDAETSLRTALDGRQSTIWTAMPGIIESVNFEKMTCSVQLAIQGQITDENGNVQYVDIKPLVDVPILFPSAGGFLLTLPLSQGDEVLVVLASRCIDSWWQSGGFQNKAMEARMHDLSDGFAIPGPRSIPNVVSSISSTAAQLRNDAGTTYLEISPDGKIKLVTPSSIEITGNLNVSGNIVAAQVTAGAVALTTHTHLPGTYTAGGIPVIGTSGGPI